MKTIKFKILHNVNFDLNLENSQVYQPPMTTVEMETPIGKALVASFDMDKVHSFTLPDDDEPKPIERTEGMTDGWYDRLQDAEMTRAIAAREKNADVIKRLAQYVEAGVLEVVTDEPIGSTAEAA